MGRRKPTHHSTVTMRQAATAYVQGRRARAEILPATVKWYDDALYLFTKAVGPKRYVTSLEKADIERFQPSRWAGTSRPTPCAVGWAWCGCGARGSWTRATSTPTPSGASASPESPGRCPGASSPRQSA